MSTAGNEIDDGAWYQAKTFLNKTLKGRQVVQHVENSLPVQSTDLAYAKATW
jgi:hypothetical protein